MDQIISTYDNIPLNRLYSELNQKIGELHKIEKEEAISASEKSDYIEQLNDPYSKYDENDFQRVLNKFKNTDAAIRSHEQIHATIGHTTAPISYNYQQGPDGKMYVVGGSVRLDTSITDDPKAAAFKLDQIARSAGGPADSSGADSMIVSQANLNKMLISQKGSFNADQ